MQGRFLGDVLGPLVSVRGTLNVSLYQDILVQARPIKTWMSRYGVEELDLTSRSPLVT